jgi:hypothetical protein
MINGMVNNGLSEFLFSDSIVHAVDQVALQHIQVSLMHWHEASNLQYWRSWRYYVSPG